MVMTKEEKLEKQREYNRLYRIKQKEKIAMEKEKRILEDNEKTAALIRESDLAFKATGVTSMERYIEYCEEERLKYHSTIEALRLEIFYKEVEQLRKDSQLYRLPHMFRPESITWQDIIRIINE